LMSRLKSIVKVDEVMMSLARCSLCSRTLRAGFAGGPKKGHPWAQLRVALEGKMVGTNGCRIQSNKGMSLKPFSFGDRLNLKVLPMSPVAQG